MRDQGFSIADIHEKLQNHFKTLCFYCPDFLAGTYFDQNFLDNAQANGLNTALNGRERSVRTRYLRRLECHKRDPLNIGKLRKRSIEPGIKSLSFLKTSKYTPSSGPSSGVCAG